jgi:multidrug efflux pump subunit AcrA (membrane-fusion protein)
MQWTRYLKFGIPIVVGIAGTVLLLNGVKPPEKSASLLELKAVKYLVVQPEEAFSEMSIAGTIEASEKWSAVAQVKGEIYRSNDSIVEGLWVNAGDVILKIDPLDYELAISQISAELSGIEYELSLLNAEAENTQRIGKPLVL